MSIFVAWPLANTKFSRQAETTKNTFYLPLMRTAKIDLGKTAAV